MKWNETRLLASWPNPLDSIGPGLNLVWPGFQWLEPGFAVPIYIYNPLILFCSVEYVQNFDGIQYQIVELIIFCGTQNSAMFACCRFHETFSVSFFNVSGISAVYLRKQFIYYFWPSTMVKSANKTSSLPKCAFPIVALITAELSTYY